MKKALTVLLATLMVASLFISCGEDPFFHHVSIKYEDKVVKTEIVRDGEEYALPKEVEGVPKIIGWTVDEKEYAVGEKITIKGDTTITAIVGTPVVITLYDDVTETKYLKPGETELTLPEAPKRDGYDFDGWKVGETTYAAEATVAYTEGMTIAAVWTKINSITVDNGDGTTQVVTVRADKTELTLPAAPTRTGYSFEGWKIGETTYAAGTEAPYTEGMTITGVWKKIYTVTYNANTGSGTVEPDTFKEGSEGVTIKGGDGLTHSSLYFRCWNTQADGGGTSYDAGAKYNGNNDLTLYAVWTQGYTVTFNLNGGTATTAIDSQFVSEYASKPDVTPKSTEKYKTFAYWSLDGTSEFKFASTKVSENIELKAVYRDYAVGDTGPAGGYIFYDAGSAGKTTTYGTQSITWRYLEAALTDATVGSSSTGKYTWGTNGTFSTKYLEFGDGWINSKIFEANTLSNFPAAKACADYGNGTSYDDWFLPSLNELYEMYAKMGYKYFKYASYWTSTEVGNYADEACTRYMSGGAQGSAKRSAEYYVRPIRAF